jgi:hypothetical protein
MTITVPAPSISRADFACPNCGSHSGQAWYKGFADRITDGDKVPTSLSQEKIKAAIGAAREANTRESLGQMLGRAQKIDLGLPFLESDNTYVGYRAYNIHFSQCFTCTKLAVWLHDKLIYPNKRTGIAPHADLPEEIFHDFEEARTILELSPRGAAALLRLVLQKLFVHLGETGDINAAITSLIKRGLDPIVRDALDSVRVIGNEAVHPGQMDLRDDLETVSELFYVINFITEKMITEPKKLKAIYDKLPPEKRAAIDARNAKAMGNP